MKRREVIIQLEIKPLFQNNKQKKRFFSDLLGSGQDSSSSSSHVTLEKNCCIENRPLSCHSIKSENSGQKTKPRPAFFIHNKSFENDTLKWRHGRVKNVNIKINFENEIWYFVTSFSLKRFSFIFHFTFTKWDVEKADEDDHNNAMHFPRLTNRWRYTKRITTDNSKIIREDEDSCWYVHSCKKALFFFWKKLKRDENNYRPAFFDVEADSAVVGLHLPDSVGGGGGSVAPARSSFCWIHWSDGSQPKVYQ